MLSSLFTLSTEINKPEMIRISTFYDPTPLHLYFYISVSHIWCDCYKAKIPAYCMLLLAAKNALIFALFTILMQSQA